MLSYLLNTFFRYARSVYLVKNEAHSLGPVSNLFWIDDIKRFQTVVFPETSQLWPTKIALFWPTNDNLFCVTPNACRKQTLVFQQVKTFLATAPPNLTAPRQTPGLDPPLTLTLYFIESQPYLQRGNRSVKQTWQCKPLASHIGTLAALPGIIRQDNVLMYFWVMGLAHFHKSWFYCEKRTSKNVQTHTQNSHFLRTKILFQTPRVLGTPG